VVVLLVPKADILVYVAVSRFGCDATAFTCRWHKQDLGGICNAHFVAARWTQGCLPWYPCLVHTVLYVHPQAFDRRHASRIDVFLAHCTTKMQKIFFLKKYCSAQGTLHVYPQNFAAAHIYPPHGEPLSDPQEDGHALIEGLSSCLCFSKVSFPFWEISSFSVITCVWTMSPKSPMWSTESPFFPQVRKKNEQAYASNACTPNKLKSKRSTIYDVISLRPKFAKQLEKMM
jgi:hypothetical protein